MYTYLHAHTVELSVSCFLLLENEASRYQKKKKGFANTRGMMGLRIHPQF